MGSLNGPQPQRLNGGKRPYATFGPDEDDFDSDLPAAQDMVIVDPLSRGQVRDPWQKHMLRSGLQDYMGEFVAPPSTGTWKIGQLVLLLAVFLTFAAVLISNVLSKFSFIAIVREMNDARALKKEEELNTSRGSVAMAMLTLIVCIPPMVTFLSCVWHWCYAAHGNNPWPCLRSWKYNIFQAVMEVLGLCTFVFCVATRLDAGMVLAIMPAIFPVLGSSRLWLTRGYWLFGGQESDVEEEALEPLAGHTRRSKRTMQRRLSRYELVGYVIAAAVQLLGLICLPIFLYVVADASIYVCALTSAACVCLSIAWLPGLHKKIRDPGHDYLQSEVEDRPSFLPQLPRTARGMAYMFNSLLRLGLTVVYIVVYSHVDPSWQFTSINDALGKIQSSPMLVPFLVQILVSFAGYNAARLACLLTIQRVAFALPLLMASPLALIVFLVWPDFPLFALPSNDIPHLWAVIAFNLLYWMSEVFLEQFTLLNRRAPSLFQKEDIYEDMRSPKEELERSIIFICTTMYREDEEEMRQVIKSLIGLAPVIGNVCEAHVFMDGGANGDILQQFALQLVHLLGEEVHHRYPHVEKFIQSGRKVMTPYGIRLEWMLPESNMPFIAHLKDGGKVKNKKILYMYYFLQFRFPVEGGPNEVGYILATDADVRFEPEDVLALHTLLSRDKRVGAVCGRTFPIGHGPLVWYQMFDYAIGHWFQKAAEHVLGSVLCCPGCFSMYRLDALRSTLQTYCTGVDQAFDFLIKDMGEDRWLCTLLVQEGWRLDFTATASDYTHCPTGFDEFFNQRRRWIMSTLANIIALLQGWEKATTNNNSISLMFIVYQALMLFSTVISPATVLLVIIGGMHYAVDMSVSLISGLLLALVAIFIIICMGGASQANQLLAAKLFTLMFAFLMCAVVIGVASEIASEFHDPNPSSGGGSGPTHSPHNFSVTATTMPYTARHLLDEADKGAGIFAGTAISVSTIYLFGIIAMFLVAGVMHLNEAGSLVHGILYILCLPGGYLFLIIYSFANLNDRSWGTREEAQKKAQTTNSGWDELLAGCGRYPKESLIKFFGRVLCCRAATPPPPPEQVNPYALISAPEKKEETPIWHLEYLTDQRFRAVCQPVEDLLGLVRNLAPPISDRDLAKLTTVTARAVAAYPDLASNGSWARYWDASKRQFRVQTGSSLNDLPFKDTMVTEIAAMTGSLLWDVSQPVLVRDDLSKPLDVFLDGIHVKDMHVRNVLRENGYDDDTFFFGLKEDDLRTMGFHELINGRALIKRLLEASSGGKLKLQRPTVPACIPTSLAEWLTYLHLECYANNFRALGYGQNDLVLLENFSSRDITALGLRKRAHIKKLQDGIKKLGELLFQGRQPEGPSKELIERLDTREMVRLMQLAAFEESMLVPRHVRAHEDAFWQQLVSELLDHRLDPIENVANLKADLEKLRNTAVLSLIVINALWMVLMIVMTTAAAQSLSLLGTNPLGLAFLMLFGFLFFLQFVSMLWHRVGALVECLASMEIPKFADPRETRVEN